MNFISFLKILYHFPGCVNAFNLLYSFFVFDVAVAAGELSFVFVDAAVELGALQGSGTAGMTEQRVLVLHRKTHLKLLLMSLQAPHFLDVLHVPASAA